MPHSAMREQFFSRIFGLRNPFYDASTLAHQVTNRTIQPGTVNHRQHIYLTDMYCMPGGNGDTSRRRPATPRFYRENVASTHRLVQFLMLELRALIHNENEREILMRVIASSLTTTSINSSKFQQLISQYTTHRTIHFIHEFYNFAISVHDSVERYFQQAIYVSRSEAQVVQIRYEQFDEQPFDLSDPYNFRNSRSVYNDINNNVNPFSGASSSRIGYPDRTASSASSTSSARSCFTSTSSTRTGSTALAIPSSVRRPVELDAAFSSSSSSSSESDDDVIFEGITKATSGTLNSRRTGHDQTGHDRARSEDHANESNPACSTSSTAEAETDPQPDPSGLSNNRINLTLNQLRTHYMDDSDDYDSDNYLSRNNASTGLRYFESDDDDDEEQRRLDELKRGLEDSSDDDNSIEYVGYVKLREKPRYPRTPEVIELTSDEDECEAGSAKRLKTEQREKPEAAAEKSIKCICKIRCKVECKRASV